MVVQAILALALALPTGALFGVGYGTGVRIGYEQIYPLLFPKTEEIRRTSVTRDNINEINKIYNAIGGKEASQMGIAKGLADAMGTLDKNPDFQALVELEFGGSGTTRSRYGLDKPSAEQISSSQEALSRKRAEDLLAANPLIQTGKFVASTATAGPTITSEQRFQQTPIKINSSVSKIGSQFLVDMSFVFTKSNSDRRLIRKRIAIKGNLKFLENTYIKWQKSNRARPSRELSARIAKFKRHLKDMGSTIKQIQ